jgi:serine/threonine-protein kinase RsbW
MLPTMAGSQLQISITFPGTPEYLRLARLAAADVGSRAGFDYEEIDDLRIAVSELCHLISGEGSPEPVTLDFTLEPDGVRLEGRAATRTPHPDNELSAAIIAAVVDEHAVFRDGAGMRFRMLKRRRAAAVG